MTTPGTGSDAALPRVVGVFGAVMMGLGSIIGTGVFVSIGIAAGVAGPGVVLAIAIAALIAAANGLSSAQLAAAYPVAGGTYEYGYRVLHPSLGFTAGWMFLCAKSASAATASLGFAGYLLGAMQVHSADWGVRVSLALAAVIVLTIVVLAGLRRSNVMNIIIVSISLGVLVFFVVLCAPMAMREGGVNLSPVFGEGGNASASAKKASPFPGMLEACALMFVAYTGYGRIATLGEEITNPKRNIPIAIIITLIISAALYISVALAGIGAVGIEVFGIEGAARGAPLEVTAQRVSGHWAGLVITFGAVTAMLGVLLNLILGLSRVALAMGRRGDLPAGLGKLDASGSTPRNAVLFVSVIIGGLALIGNVKTAWSFSAFTVLIYYAITNLAALRLPREARRYPRWIAVAGLAGCAFLAFWVQPVIWMIGLGLIAAGLVWHVVMRTRRQNRKLS
ncbi:MAG: APC family permease [Phycisphaeraceae bacterium]